MTAALLVGHGGPSQLVVRDDVEVPSPGPGEVLVRVGAAGVNTTDVWSREGAYGRADDPEAVAGWRGVPLGVPLVQGADVVGRVVAVGDGVAAGLAGRRVLLDPARYEQGSAEPELVAVMGSEFDGGFAEYVVVDEVHAHDVESSPLSDVELACLPIAYGTAMGMLDRAGLQAGERVVVTGASGGVGQAVTQLASALGADVVAVTSTGAGDVVLRSGARVAVDRQSEDVVAEVAAACRGGEADVVVDVVGAWALDRLFDLLATGGRWVTCGAVAGVTASIDLRQLYLRNRRLIGSTMHTPAQFARLVEQACAGTLAPHVEASYAIEEIHDAQEHFARPERTGRIVVQPRPRQDPAQPSGSATPPA